MDGRRRRRVSRFQIATASITTGTHGMMARVVAVDVSRDFEVADFAP